MLFVEFDLEEFPEVVYDIEDNGEILNPLFSEEIILSSYKTLDESSVEKTLLVDLEEITERLSEDIMYQTSILAELGELDRDGFRQISKESLHYYDVNIANTIDILELKEPSVDFLKMISVDLAELTDLVEVDLFANDDWNDITDVDSLDLVEDSIQGMEGQIFDIYNPINTLSRFEGEDNLNIESDSPVDFNLNLQEFLNESIDLNIEKTVDEENDDDLEMYHTMSGSISEPHIGITNFSQSIATNAMKDFREKYANVHFASASTVNHVTYSTSSYYELSVVSDWIGDHEYVWTRQSSKSKFTRKVGGGRMRDLKEYTWEYWDPTNKNHFRNSPQSGSELASTGRTTQIGIADDGKILSKAVVSISFTSSA